jgi:hypothetical protein
MIGYRAHENARQTLAMGDPSMAPWLDSVSSSVYLPDRYLWPFELAIVLLTLEAVRLLVDRTHG